MQELCAKCHAPMTCQPEGGCWCAELPHLSMPADAAEVGCLCRVCLLEKIKAGRATTSGDSPATSTSDSGSAGS